MQAFATPTLVALRPAPPPVPTRTSVPAATPASTPRRCTVARVSAPPRSRARPKLPRPERLATLDVSLKPRLLTRAAYLGPVALHKVSGALELAESVDVVLTARNVAVADICVQLGMDCDTVCAAILRGMVGLLGAMAVEAAVGTGVLAILSCFDDIDEIVLRAEDARFTEESYAALRSLVLLAARDEHRALSLRLAAAVVDARTLDSMTDSRGLCIAARRFMYLEAALANQLGMWYLQSELEESAFRHLHPMEYSRTKEALRERVAASDKLLETTKGEIESVLHRARGVRSLVSRARVVGRVKGAYSVYRKMQRSRKRLDQIYDVLALRVIIAPKRAGRDSDECAACYAVAQAIRDFYPTLENREKDYLRRPKSNGYRSVHLTILTGNQHDPQPLEVQIRTEKMHHVAEFGAAAHWIYKEPARSTSAAPVCSISAGAGAAATPTSAARSRINMFMDLEERARQQNQPYPRPRIPPSLAPAAEADEKRRGYVANVATAIQSSRVIVKCVGQLWAMHAGATIRDLIADLGVGGLSAAATVNGARVPLAQPLRMNDSVILAVDR